MNISLLQKAGFLQTLGGFLDLIPKTIYYIYACLASAVDAMQALVRKLAGLDVYYSASGETIAGQDPLTEFIYGILGIGENAEVYKGLSTVFWSLAIFGVLMLAVSTMIAIIKSHYNEDTAGTSPWKFIYQAIKAALTFIAIPAVVLLGMRLNTFVLSTLDKITAGSAGKEQIESVYGSTAAELFEPGYPEGVSQESGNETYIYYDYFSFGSPTNSTTFSGLLFKAAAYTSNRARLGNVTDQQYRNITVGTTSIFANDDCANYERATDKQEYVAYQIDFAFQNNLKLNKALWYSDIMVATGFDVVGIADVLGVAKWYWHFTKFSPALIWQFYDLWQFNFILGFAAVFATFSMMISIILGLLSRLIKGTALFLIYPALLGLAPLDNFKAFKEWGSQFLKQVLMAIGSIIGFNILLLILPYVTNIDFFKAGVLDALVDALMVIVGLVMAKDFISMVSGFAGGADALSVGGALKSDVSANIKKGLGTTVKAGAGTARIVSKAFNSGIIKPIKKGTAANRANKQKGKAYTLESELNKKDAELRRANQERDGIYDDIEKDMTPEQISSIVDAEAAARKKYKDTHKDNANEKEEESAAKEARQNAIKKFKSGDARLVTADEKVLNAQRIKERKEKEFNKAKDKEEHLVEKYGLKKAPGSDDYASYGSAIMKQERKDHRRESLENAGEAIKTWGRKFTDAVDSASIGKTISDVFLKNMTNIGANMGIDKTVAGAVDMLKGTFTFRGGIFKGKDQAYKELTGDKLAQKNAEKADEAAEKQLKATQEQTKALQDLVKANAETKEEIKKLKGSGSSGGSGGSSS